MTDKVACLGCSCRVCTNNGAHLSSILNYLDFMRQSRFSITLIQGMRDFFGPRMYGRNDEERIFHTLWSGNRSEEKQS